MQTYQKLIDYIPYFEDERIEFFNRNSTGFPSYDTKFNEFINEVYRTNLLEGNYLEYLEKRKNNQSINDLIELADFELLKAILTYFVRSERFCDGSWAAALDDKAFLKILYRLREL